MNDKTLFEWKKVPTYKKPYQIIVKPERHYKLISKDKKPDEPKTDAVL